MISPQDVAAMLTLPTKLNVLLDTETTGIGKQDQVIELSYVALPDNLSMLKANISSVGEDLLEFWHVVKKNSFNSLYKPSVPIHPEASKVHGLMFKDLLGKPSSDSITLPPIHVMIGHNIQFDHRMLGKPDVKLLCTMQLARELNKKEGLGITSFSMDNLLSTFFSHNDRAVINNIQVETRGKGRICHSSLVDCFKNLVLLYKLSGYYPNIVEWEDLYTFLNLLKQINKNK